MFVDIFLNIKMIRFIAKSLALLVWDVEEFQIKRHIDRHTNVPKYPPYKASCKSPNRKIKKKKKKNVGKFSHLS